MRNIFSLVCVSVSIAFGNLAHAQSPVDPKINFDVIDNRVFVDVYMNGSGPFKMILDSNSSSLAVSPGTARKLNLPLLNPTPCGGAGVGQQICYDTHLDSATVAGIPTRVDDASVTPTSSISQVIGFQKFDGVLGIHFFEEHVLKFDYRNHRLKCSSARAAAPIISRVTETSPSPIPTIRQNEASQYIRLPHRLASRD